MASRLIELGDLHSARTELIQGRAEAERLSDTFYVEFAGEDQNNYDNVISTNVQIMSSGSQYP
jgi:hypothetical protein